MVREYEIHNIEPFNDIFYKTCMYNPLLTGIYYSGGSVIPFLSNDFFTYSYNENEGFKLNGENIQAIPEFELIKDMGISIDNILNSENYIEDIKAAIDNEIPVFVPIDRYYWSDSSVNSGTYNIRHFPHYFLVFGYNDLENTFKVIDVAENGSGCFKYAINCNELIECYNGYCKFLRDDFKMFKIHPNSCYSNNSDFMNISKYALTYKNNFNEKKVETLSGLQNIKKAIDFYQSSHSDTSLILKEDQRSISMPFAFIERAKKVQMYQVYTFFGHKQQIFEPLKAIIDNLNVIKGLLLKIVITQTYSEKSINAVVNKLDQIYQLEISYYENLTSILNDWREN